MVDGAVKAKRYHSIAMLFMSIIVCDTTVVIMKSLTGKQILTLWKAATQNYVTIWPASLEARAAFLHHPGDALLLR